MEKSMEIMMGNEDIFYDEMEDFIQKGIELNKKLSQERMKSSSSNSMLEKLELERKKYEQQLKLYIDKAVNK